MINMLKTSIDTAPPPSATLPFTHPKKAPAPEPHTKVVCTKVRESGICKLMSVRSHAAQFSELKSNAMEHWQPQTRFPGHIGTKFMLGQVGTDKIC